MESVAVKAQIGWSYPNKTKKQSYRKTKVTTRPEIYSIITARL